MKDVTAAAVWQRLDGLFDMAVVDATERMAEDDRRRTDEDNDDDDDDMEAGFALPAKDFHSVIADMKRAGEKMREKPDDWTCNLSFSRQDQFGRRDPIRARQGVQAAEGDVHLQRGAGHAQVGLLLLGLVEAADAVHAGRLLFLVVVVGDQEEEVKTGQHRLENV